MSILPPLNQGSTSSFSSSNSQSSSTSNNHGAVCVSSSQQSTESHNQFSGQVATGAHGSNGSRKKVKGKERLNYEKPQIDQNGERNETLSQESRSSEWLVKESGTIAANQSTRTSSSQTSSGQSSGKKPQIISGNHLLNFQYDPINVRRPQPKPQLPRRHKKSKPYNKDLFFQANYKFIVLDSGNYKPESMDPDKMLCWDDVICLRYTSPYPIQCPICLDNLLCPQITSCGHIFCFPCILQYFSVDEDGVKEECWKKCPLCFTMISSRDLHTVQVENVKHYHVGEDIEFVLLSRPKDSLKSFLKNNDHTNVDEEILHAFSKFTLTSDVELSVREAMSDLDGWLARADSGLVDDIERLPYVCAAMEQLEQRKRYWIECRNSNGSTVNESFDGSPPTRNSPSNNDERSMWSQKSSAEKILRNSSPSQVVESSGLPEDHEKPLSSSFDETKCLEKPSDDVKEVKDGESYTFYQAADGQHIILHSLNMKCLLHHYGSYESLPNRITGKILQLETVTQTEAMRRRYRFLSHFSLTTTFQLCEIYLGDKLPAESLSPFMDEIKNRERQRKRLARKETKDKFKAEAASSQFAPVPYYLYDASRPSPSFSMDEFEALGNPPLPSFSPPNIAESKSFSNVARLGFAAAHDSPALKSGVVENSPSIDRSPNTSNTTGRISFANITSRPKPTEAIDVPKASEVGNKKGKKSSRVLLSTAGGRRY